MLIPALLFAVDLGFGGALGLGTACPRSIYIEAGKDFNGYAAYLRAGYNKNGFLAPVFIPPTLPGFTLIHNSHGPFSSLFLNWGTGSCGINTGLLLGLTASYLYSLENEENSIMLIPCAGTFFKSPRDTDSSFIKFQVVGAFTTTRYSGIIYAVIEASLTIFPWSTAGAQDQTGQPVQHQEN